MLPSKSTVAESGFNHLEGMPPSALLADHYAQLVLVSTQLVQANVLAWNQHGVWVALTSKLHWEQTHPLLIVRKRLYAMHYVYL